MAYAINCGVARLAADAMSRATNAPNASPLYDLR
jgi:hypothetical protein